MKKINCIIADDEMLAREIIENYVNQLDSLKLVGSCANGAEVFNALKAHHADLLFLDIQMPLLTGIELLRTLKNPPSVILTTAYREFAVEGYELDVIDYLLKPISFERFLKAIEKYELRVNPAGTTSNHKQPVEKKDALDFIYLKADKKMVRVLLTDILYIEALKDYVKVHAKDKSVITYQTLTYFEEKLSADQFIRVHRSYIISSNHINAFSATQVEIGKACIPIGSSYTKEVLRKLLSK
jgi:DNA-binding LytR/AlgR family response regulator